MGRVIGKGSYGEVRFAVHKELNIQCAIKIITKQSVNKSNQRAVNLLNELLVLQDVSGQQGLLRTYEMLHDETCFYIISELLIFGDMFQFMNQR